MDRKNCVCSDDSERCMMGQCKECPGQNGLVDCLNQCDEFIDVEEETYKQWVSTDQTQYYWSPSQNPVFKLTRHSYTAKCQSGYMKKLKTSMTPMEEIVVRGDFAENYSYVVQDEIQSFHWENKQATLHPFVGYQRQEDNTLQHRNIIIMCY